ncbi:transposase [Streptomyces sp. NPDC058572]|uniref:transposase n=1 Tax=Streptomyces sp. NPDC058572 TaxID=3346546 RepID=UPI00364B22F1
MRRTAHQALLQLARGSTNPWVRKSDARQLHLIRTPLRYISRQDGDAAAHDLRPVHTAANEDEAFARLAEFSEKWEAKYPTAVRAWERSWSEAETLCLGRRWPCRLVKGASCLPIDVGVSDALPPSP